ncbi:hypothetical protein MUN82_08950 [Hymenobacter aerilatus]|uniref:Uncharacterized protein n=1 Tax=Hymenobacter aerilatus TaxID=2932251 RepID=A0A8T9T0P5_9BACT|nr:hypothetical protein [Hymenobacter aerilatus]UOR07211.1 hypothetical protein MUN82_08950 [Hymenobacter aerilatus]
MNQNAYHRLRTALYSNVFTDAERLALHPVGLAPRKARDLGWVAHYLQATREGWTEHPCSQEEAAEHLQTYLCTLVVDLQHQGIVEADTRQAWQAEYKSCPSVETLLKYLRGLVKELEAVTS